jgi:hypothetical protein
MGTSETSLIAAEQHVETATAFPFMQSGDWKEFHVLEARSILSRLPEEEPTRIAEMLTADSCHTRLNLGVRL